MLELAQIPIRAADRGDLPLADPGAPPLIFAGGPTATSNPEPFAAFFDFVVLGDGEEVLPEIGLVVAEAKAAGLSRRELLLDLAQVPGVYVPSLYGPGADGVTQVPLVPGIPARVLRRWPVCCRSGIVRSRRPMPPRCASWYSVPAWAASSLPPCWRG